MWGSPWVPRYSSWKTGFNKSQEEMRDHWRDTLLTAPPGKPRPGIDVLLTHTPAYGILDRDPHGGPAGCRHLAAALGVVKPMYHVCGHVHADHGVILSPGLGEGEGTVSINAASVSDYYWVGQRRPILVDIPVQAPTTGALTVTVADM